MKQVLSFSILVLMMSASLSGAAQSTRSTPARLYIKSTEQKRDFVAITYEINFPGFVELHLFNSDGEKLWIKGNVTDRKGLGVVRVPIKPLEPGKFYPYILKYKGRDYKGTIFM